MPLIEWNSGYSIGIQAMDNQHIKLVDLINKFDEAIQTGKAKETVGVILKDLNDYTKFHFGDEEVFLQKHSYPELDSQKSEHIKFISKLDGFEKDNASGKNAALTFEISIFLKKWLINHILKSDMAYGKYLNAKGIK